MFRLADFVTNGKVFLSTLHTNEKKWGIIEHIHTYILDHTMGGLYPIVKGNELTTQALHYNFKEISRDDKTEDYRYSAIVSKNSWQKTSIWHICTECRNPLLNILCLILLLYYEFFPPILIHGCIFMDIIIVVLLLMNKKLLQIHS